MEIYECNNCGMENSEGDLVWNNDEQKYECPDCGSQDLHLIADEEGDTE